MFKCTTKLNLHTASLPPGEAHSGRARTRRDPAATASDDLGDEPIPETQRGPGQHGRRPAPTDPALRGPVASRLGARAIDDADTRHRLDQLALSLEVEERGAVGPACFGPRIRDEPFLKGSLSPVTPPSTTAPSSRRTGSPTTPPPPASPAVTIASPCATHLSCPRGRPAPG